MSLITGYCTPGASRNEVEWLVCWWNECMPQVKNKYIIINYKSMAQYVHGTSVQQCLLDQLSGASLAQSTQHVMYHLLFHWNLTSSNSASAILPSTFTDCTNSHPPIPTTSTSSCCIISLHLGSRCSSLPLLEGIDHVHLDLQGIWKVNFGRRLFMPWLRMQVCTTPLKKVVPSSASKECQVVSSSAKHRYQWHNIGTNLQIPGWRPKPHVT